MKVEIKNSNVKPLGIKPLFDYFQALGDAPNWEYNGLLVELDPTIDFKGNDALIRWTDTQEGFNDKVIVESLAEFQLNFRILDA